MEHPKSNTFVVALLFAACCGAPVASEERPTPTPTPANLADYARQVRLRRDAASDGTRITIDNENVETIGRDRALVLGVAAVPPVATPRPAKDERAVRTRWRSHYDAQRRRIADTERRIEAVDHDIDLLGRQRLTPRVMARLDSARAKLAELERELQRRRAELARIVREARRHGAEPGWFR